MHDPSTAHVSRVWAALGRTDEWLAMADELAPEGFDELRDAVCIHRKGTLLYASAATRRVLDLDDGDSLVGGAIADWIHPRDRARVQATLTLAADDALARVTTAGVKTKSGRTALVELTALGANDAARPFEILYLRTLRFEALPHGEDERHMAIPEPTAREGVHRKSILICDDEARLGTLTAGLLSEYGFTPVTVGTGEDAIVALSNEDLAIDLVLLDVNLSHGKPARDVLASIEEAGNRVRVVLTSGLAEEDVDPKLMRHPAVAGYVAKPYGVDQLVRSIERALGTAGS